MVKTNYKTCNTMLYCTHSNITTHMLRLWYICTNVIVQMYNILNNYNYDILILKVKTDLTYRSLNIPMHFKIILTSHTDNFVDKIIHI